MQTAADIFGIGSSDLAAINNASPEAPPQSPHTAQAPALVGGSWHAAFTDWKASPTFWLAVFAILALGAIHAEAHVRTALGGASVGVGRRRR